MLDLRGHNEGIEFLMQLVKNKHTLTEADIRSLHKMILVEPYSTRALTLDGQTIQKTVHLGDYKSMPNHVKTPTGEMHYYATPEETPARMQELMDWHRKSEAEGVPALVRAAVFHYNFVAIHPFDDGNERIARLLMNLILMQDGFPPLIVRKEDRSLYLAALREADAGNMAEFVKFLGENLLRSLEIYLRGARGEDINEPDDLDKEIALLKTSLAQQPTVTINRSDLVVGERFKDSILPLFQEVHKACLKLKEFFLQTNIEVEALYQGGARVRYELGPRPLAEIKIPPTIEEPFGNWYSLFQVDFSVDFNGFNRSRGAERVGRLLTVVFQEFSFSIKDDVKVLLEKLYHEQLSPEEAKGIRDAYVGEIIQTIKGWKGGLER